MAEKSRRNGDREIRLSEEQMRRPGTEEIGRTDKATGSSAETSGLAEEYHYVVADLQRIGVIALVMLGALVALAVFLP